MIVNATREPLWYGSDRTRADELHHVACHRIIASTIIPVHTISAAELALVVKGRLTLRVGDRDLSVPGGSCMLLPAGATFGSGDGENRGLVYWIGIDPNPRRRRHPPLISEPEAQRLARLLDARGLSPVRCDDETLAAAQSTFAMAHAGGADSLLQRGAALTFIGRLAALFEQAEATAAPLEAPRDTVAPALRMIEERLTETIPLPELMRACNLSRTTFNIVFREATGFSPRDYINERKIAAARQLLRDRRLNVLDVAQRLGFSSGQYFATVFRRITGATPTAYQQAQQQQAHAG